MKVKLLRATMIAGVPTDSGSIVDVEQHTGEYLVAIDKAEAYVEACEAPIPSAETLVEKEPISIISMLISLLFGSERLNHLVPSCAPFS